jgi:hypothetical protein
MRNAVNLLSEIMSSPDWSPAWMTLEEINAAMNERNMWAQRPFRNYQGGARLALLDKIIRNHSGTGEALWVQMGSRFKHAALLTDDDQVRLQDWQEACRAAFDEDLNRILLGEPPLWRRGNKAAEPVFRDLLRQARPLVEELSSYVHDDYSADERIDSEETPPVAKRIGELAVALTNLFECSADRAAHR